MALRLWGKTHNTRPSPAKSRYGQGRRDERYESNDDPSLSTPNARDGAPRQDVGRRFITGPEAGGRRQQSTIERGPGSGPSGAENFGTSYGPRSNPALSRGTPSDAETTRALPRGRESRPYGNNRKHEALTLNPARRPQSETYDSKSRTNPTRDSKGFEGKRTPPYGAKNRTGEEDVLHPLSEREIVDVSDDREVPSHASRAGPIPSKSVSDKDKQASGLYLGCIDVEEGDPPAQKLARSSRDVFSQPTARDRGGAFSDRRSMSSEHSSSIYRETVIDRSPQIVQPYLYTSGPSFWSHGYHGYHDYGHSYGWGHPWVALPWTPCRVVRLPRQTTFTEISIDYFEQESPSVVDLDTRSGLEVINRYYDGWRDAYAEALSGGHNISNANRTQIMSARQKLQDRHDEAIRKLRSGDQAVLRETLDKVKMDRQMAVDMPVEQVQWATPWIQEVWIDQHGDIHA